MIDDVKREYISAAQYIKNVMKEPNRLGAIIGKAEKMAALEKKIVGLGQDLDKKDIEHITQITPKELFGYSENKRQKRIDIAVKFYQAEKKAKTDAATSMLTKKKQET